MKLVENVLNMVCVFLLAYMGGGTMLRHMSKKTSAPAPLRIGEVVPVQGVDWAHSPLTLVFVQSTACRFCAESSGFYRNLLARRDASRWAAISVMPQEVSTARQYMSAAGYQVSSVIQMDLADIGVSGTPTLLLVDSAGVLQQQWVGRLSPSDEADVADSLGIRDWERSSDDEQVDGVVSGGGPVSPVIHTRQLEPLLVRGDVNILDVRERGEFARGRLANAHNIPVGELSVRAPHELDPEWPTVVYCKFSAACDANGLVSLCTTATEALRVAGIENVRIIRDPLAMLQLRGIDVQGDAATP